MTFEIGDPLEAVAIESITWRTETAAVLSLGPEGDERLTALVKNGQLFAWQFVDGETTTSGNAYLQSCRYLPTFATVQTIEYDIRVIE